MNWRNPSKPEPVEDPRPEPRHYDSNTGDAARDGYSVFKRRPRVRQQTEPIDPDRADRIEEIFGVGKHDETDPGY